MKQVTRAAFSLRHGRGNDRMVSGLSPLREDTAQMAGEFQTSRYQVGRASGLDRRWLVDLIDAMEQAASPEVREIPCDPWLVAATSAHLARPAASFAHCGSAYNLRN
ncbi:hypothetical protein [Bradyrhizobium ivorense]|uniref:hypothetical protein n=1 Tax=Bradyrhizobium ivorense TaxID=2511166 RepID=UPI001E322B6B|nr:hypothetical protein [Bradyrhizobium ivorense]